MVIDVSKIIGPEKARFLLQGNLHKIAAAEIGCAEFNLKEAIGEVGRQMFLKQAIWKTIGAGIAALSKLQED